MTKLLRLSGRKNAQRVKTKGELFRGKHMHIRWLRGMPFRLRSSKVDSDEWIVDRKLPTTHYPLSTIYVGILASTKLDKSAVKRNRMRRRCREALRLELQRIPNPEPRIPSVQLLILPRSSSLACDFRELQSDISRFFSSL